MDVMFLGLSKNQWDLINGFANWLAAIGTLSAVFLSLYLARNGSKPKAKLSANSIVVVDFDMEGPARQKNFVQMRVVNIGDREFNVVSIGWRMGKPRKRKLFAQMFSNELSSALPIKLTHGETGTWLFPIAGKEDWYTRMSSSFEVNWASELRSLEFVVSTSIGNEFYCSPDDKIVSRLRESLINRYGPSSLFMSVKKILRIFF